MEMDSEEEDAALTQDTVETAMADFLEVKSPFYRMEMDSEEEDTALTQDTVEKEPSEQVYFCNIC